MPTKPVFGFALEYVTDIQAARRFYTDVVGLEVTREAPVFIQFKDRNGASFAIASDESLSGTRETELYWLVDDAEAAFAELAPRAEVSLPFKQLPFGKVFGLQDPTGQPCYILELSRSRPSVAV